LIITIFGDQAADRSTGQGFLVMLVKEQKEQLTMLCENAFLINKTTKNKLKQTGALSSCI